MNSFASNGECGLKQQVLRVLVAVVGEFIRQQWRMWIETATGSNIAATSTIHSPAMANVD